MHRLHKFFSWILRAKPGRAAGATGAALPGAPYTSAGSRTEPRTFHPRHHNTLAGKQPCLRLSPFYSHCPRHEDRSAEHNAAGPAAAAPVRTEGAQHSNQISSGPESSPQGGFHSSEVRGGCQVQAQLNNQ